MKKINDRRVINIPKSDYDFLKAYCDDNTLDMPKWMVKNSKEKVPSENRDEDDPLCFLREDPSIKFKTYENVDHQFRFTTEFICNVLFPGTRSDSWKIIRDKKCKRFIIKQEFLVINKYSEFGYIGVDDDTFISIKNAYKDLCDTIQWGIQENVEGGKLWWVYILDTKDDSYYE